MELEDIREFATEMGILSAHRFTDKVELIRTIQLEIGIEDCYNSELGCPHAPWHCLWEEDCGNSPQKHAA
jgi:hypothetical protein